MKKAAALIILCMSFCQKEDLQEAREGTYSYYITCTMSLSPGLHHGCLGREEHVPLTEPHWP